MIFPVFLLNTVAKVFYVITRIPIACTLSAIYRQGSPVYEITVEL